MRPESRRRRLYDFFLKHWIVSAFAVTLPSWFSLIAKFKGEALHLASGDELTTLGDAIFFPLFCFSLSFALMRSWADRSDSAKKLNAQKLFRHLLDGVNQVTRAKQERFTAYALECDGQTELDPFQEITQPTIQIQKILDNIQVTLSALFDIDRENIGLSILWKASGQAEWEFLCRVNVENDLPLAELMKNQNSSARKTIDNKLSTLFHADKRVAIAKGEYVAGGSVRNFV